MLSQQREQLAKLFQVIVDNEQSLEIVKQVLFESKGFDLEEVFHGIDYEGKNYIQPKDLQLFLTFLFKSSISVIQQIRYLDTIFQMPGNNQRNLEIIKTHLTKVSQYFDNDNLSFFELIKPKDYEQNSATYYKNNFDHYETQLFSQIQLALGRVFEVMIKNKERFEQTRQEMITSKNFDIDQLFQSIDIIQEGYINKEKLKFFLKEMKLLINDNDINIIIDFFSCGQKTNIITFGNFYKTITKLFYYEPQINKAKKNKNKKEYYYFKFFPTAKKPLTQEINKGKNPQNEHIKSFSIITKENDQVTRKKQQKENFHIYQEKQPSFIFKLKEKLYNKRSINYQNSNQKTVKKVSQFQEKNDVQMNKTTVRKIKPQHQNQFFESTVKKIHFQKKVFSSPKILKDQNFKSNKKKVSQFQEKNDVQMNKTAVKRKLNFNQNSLQEEAQQNILAPKQFNQTQEAQQTCFSSNLYKTHIKNREILDKNLEKEELRIALSQSLDFNILKAFQYFDDQKKGYLVEEDLKKGCEKLEISVTNQIIQKFLNKYDPQQAYSLKQTFLPYPQLYSDFQTLANYQCRKIKLLKENYYEDFQDTMKNLQFTFSTLVMLLGFHKDAIRRTYLIPPLRFMIYQTKI